MGGFLRRSRGCLLCGQLGLGLQLAEELLFAMKLEQPFAGGIELPHKIQLSPSLPNLILPSEGRCKQQPGISIPRVLPKVTVQLGDKNVPFAPEIVDKEFRINVVSRGSWVLS